MNSVYIINRVYRFGEKRHMPLVACSGVRSLRHYVTNYFWDNSTIEDREGGFHVVNYDGNNWLETTLETAQHGDITLEIKKVTLL